MARILPAAAADERCGRIPYHTFITQPPTVPAAPEEEDKAGSDAPALPARTQ